jgi:hypothetical protein
MSPRQKILGLLLATTFAATAWMATREASEDGVEVVEQSDRGEAANDRAPVAQAVEPAPPAAAQAAVRLAQARRDLFAAHSWYIAPPLPPPLPPPPPMAPPLPYSFLGQWREDGQQTLFLHAGARELTARAGDVLDGAWKLEAIHGTQARFVYLPLNQTRTLSLGESL